MKNKNTPVDDLRKAMRMLFFCVIALLSHQMTFAQCTTLVWSDELPVAPLITNRFKAVFPGLSPQEIKLSAYLDEFIDQGDCPIA